MPADTLRRAVEQKFPDAAKEDVEAAIARSGGFLGQALKILESGEILSPQSITFAESFAARDSLAMTQMLVAMEKYKRDQLLEMFSQWLELLEAALADRSGIRAVSTHARRLSASRSSQELLSAIRAIQKAAAYAQGNVSPAAICGWLVWELRS